jgi:hypothetical protein
LRVTGCTVGSSFLVQYVHGRRYGEGQDNGFLGIVMGVYTIRFEKRKDSYDVYCMCASNYVRLKDTYYLPLLSTHPHCRVDPHLPRSIEKIRKS